MTPICKFADVSEHDMDMLFLEELVTSKKFLYIFTSKVGISDATVVSIEHSKKNVQYGESDMTVIVETDGKRHGLLIEDKIDAVAMPEQYSRYIERGKIGVINGDYSSFDIFIVAPDKYLKDNQEAQKYPNKVSYEECKEYFEKSKDNSKTFKLAQITQAITKQKTGYQVVEHKAVTEFWNKYIAYHKENFQQLFFTATEGPRGVNSIWPQFNTTIKKLYIIHKSEKGFVDLTFPNAFDSIAQLEGLLNEMVDLKKYGLSVHPTGKSAAVRVIVPVLDFKQPFEAQIVQVEECFKAIETITEFVKVIDKTKIEKFIQRCK